MATALDADELLDPLLLVTSSPLFRLALASALEFERLMVLLGVPLEPGWPVVLGVARQICWDGADSRPPPSCHEWNSRVHL